MSKINKIRLSGTDYDIQDVSATSVVELTQQQYDDLPATAKTSNILYIITDAQAGDLTNYYTKTETNTLLGGKANTATTYTKTEVDNAITAATSTKQDTLVSSQNIKTINNTSILGSGNIDIQGGGGKAVTGGTNISVTTGETADTINCTLPISADTNANVIVLKDNTIEGTSYKSNNVLVGYNNTLSLNGTSYGNFYNLLFGNSNTIQKNNSYSSSYNIVFGVTNQLSGSTENTFISGISNKGFKSHQKIFGYGNEAKNVYECVLGIYNNSVSASTTFGDSGNTLFSVGNGILNEGRHNAFEIRQNGDIYIADTNDTSTTNWYEKPMIKLQDQLGGGGGGGTVESAITSGSTNAVESKAIWSATTFNKDVLLAFNGSSSTNYPNGCTKLKVEVTGGGVSTINFYNDNQNLGIINITNFGSIAVYNSFNGATYEISGTTVIINYPTVTNVTRIEVSSNADYVYTAVVEGAWVNENTYMKPEVDSIATSLQNNINSKQDTLVSGTNIKTINNESILGEGNIDIQGGGSSYTAGDGIDITNNVISVTGKVDTTTYETYTAATDTAIAGKQDILTGGNGIDINNDVISVTGKADTSAVTAIQDSLSGYVTTDTEQIISGRKIFTYSASSSKAIEFKQTSDTAKVGFRVRTSAETNNELASFEFRPNTFTVDGVQHPLLYFGHYRNTNTAAAGVPQTYIGFRQYDQPHDAAYHYLIPLPEKAKTPFSLTTTFKDYYAPMGFKNGSTMITADDTGVVDLSSELGGLKLVKLSQSEYDSLSSYDSNTLYVIVN